MAKQDLYNNVKVIRAIDYTAVTSGNTTTAGDVIDTAGFESVTFVFEMHGQTDGTYTPIIEDADESAFNVTNAAVADAFLLGTEAGAAFTDNASDNDVSKVGYIGKKRYVRASVVQAGGTSGGNFSAVCILGHPGEGPQSTQKQTAS